jgi:hypothetical protein
VRILSQNFAFPLSLPVNVDPADHVGELIDICPSLPDFVMNGIQKRYGIDLLLWSALQSRISDMIFVGNV